MKKCPYCAEQIHDEAIVCRFCNRDQPRPIAPDLSKQPRRVSVNWAGVAIVCALGLFAAVALVGSLRSNRSATGERKPTQILDVSGGKSALAIQITNREREPIEACAVEILEGGRSDRWTAVIEKLEPLETETLRWEQFRNGGPMPAYVGRGAKYVTVSCRSHAATRQGAGLAFE